jgi:cell division protein YceG involved in septum cleavage
MSLKIASLISIIIVAAMTSGCSTTNAVPYKADAENAMAIQQQLNGKKIKVGRVEMAAGIEENPTCRLMGPVDVAPGKTLPQYIEAALQEEVFLAQAYDTNSSNRLNGRIEQLSFSSVSPANWQITMRVNSDTSEGYTVSVKYEFSSSWDAMSACKNVANAFGPATSELIDRIVKDERFPSLFD